MPIQSLEMGLLGQQHAGGGELESRQDLLPQLIQILAAH
jgi:hypothetical protein